MSTKTPENPNVRFTILNSMAGGQIAEALDRHVEWGIDTLDLKDGIFSKRVADLTDDEAGRLAEMAADRGLSVYCLSTHLFCADVEAGEEEFRRTHLAGVGRAIEIAAILRPRFIRLLAASSARYGQFADPCQYLRREHPWLTVLYAEAVDRIAEAGFEATIENEVGGCLFDSPAAIAGFFDMLGRPGRVCLTWDVQNLWQMGTPPAVEVYEQLRGLIGYVHLKGGQADGTSRRLAWRSSLAEASWPVAEITRRVVADGRSPVICLNPSHGRPRVEGVWEDFTRRDLDFIRAAVVETEP